MATLTFVPCQRICIFWSLDDGSRQVYDNELWDNVLWDKVLWDNVLWDNVLWDNVLSDIIERYTFICSRNKI